MIDLGGVKVNPEKMLLELDRADCEDSLYLFLRNAWRYMDSSPWRDGWPIEAVAEHLQAVVDGDIKRLIINIPPRMGKQLADDTPVLTTSGWKAHGDLVVGDEVFGVDGSPVKVLAVSEKTPSNVRVEFFDGSVFYCHENHEWTLFSRTSRKWETVEAGRFLQPRRGRWGATQGRQKQVLSDGRALHQLPLTGPVQLPEADLPLPPYILGAWLGDGSASKPCITHAASDGQVIAKIESLGFAVSTSHAHASIGVLTTYFSGRGKADPSPLTLALRAAGVWGDKHIPEIYLRASIDQRLELLAGLLDTDGSVDRNSRCHFSNTNKRMIDGVGGKISSTSRRSRIPFNRVSRDFP